MVHDRQSLREVLARLHRQLAVADPTHLSRAHRLYALSGRDKNKKRDKTCIFCGQGIGCISSAFLTLFFPSFVRFSISLFLFPLSFFCV
jgi:hypothetical protein